MDGKIITYTYFPPKRYGSKPLIKLEDEEPKNAETVKLSEYLNRKGKKFTYIYDFGDDWTHSILVEKLIDQQGIRAELVDGQGACPPEDCGGFWGYANLLEALADPNHEMHEEMLDWLGLEKGEDWDAGAFDLETAKAFVATV